MYFQRTHRDSVELVDRGNFLFCQTATTCGYRNAPEAFTWKTDDLSFSEITQLFPAYGAFYTICELSPQLLQGRKMKTSC